MPRGLRMASPRGLVEGLLNRLLVVVVVLGVAAALALGGGHRRDRDVAFAVAAAALAVVCVRVFGLCALLALPFILGPLWPGTVQPSTGDEPHYLVIAQSVVADQDLAVLNNYRSPPFAGTLRPHLGWDHRTDSFSDHSVHQPGTGILVSPGWWIDKRRGALVVIAIAAALLLYEMVRLAEAFGADRRSAVTAAALVYAAPAVFDFGREVMSEIFVAVCLVHLARVARQCRTDGGVRALPMPLVVSGSLAAAALPWIHLRYVAPAGLLALMIAARAPGKRRFAPIGAMVASYVGVAIAFESWFGSPWPSAGYGPASAGYDHEGLPDARRLLGLLVDNHVGVLFAAPIVVLALSALPLIWRLDRLWTFGVAAAVGVYYLVASGWSGWWLGDSTPGRNWTPIAPLAVPLVVAGMRLVSSRVRVVLYALAVAIAVAYLAFPLSAYPLPDGVTAMYSRFHVARLAPSFRAGVGHTSLAVGAVLVVVTACVLVGLSRWASRAQRGVGDAESPQPLAATG